MEIRLRGDTNFIPLPDLLQWLEQSRKSGNLLIDCGNGQEQGLYFEDGNIIFVSSPKTGQRIGDFLAETGYIERETVDQSLTESRKFGICFTQYLLDEQMLSRKILTESLTRLARIILMDVLRSPNCNFRCTTPLHDFIHQGPIRISTSHLILDAVRKLDEMERDRKLAESTF
jgi:hypothetical protein